MKRFMAKGIIIVLYIFVSIFFIYCNNDNSNDDNGKLNIVATIGMIGDVVENIGGNKVKVTTLMGPGIDPHLYKAKEGDLSVMMKADIIFYNGLHLEAKLGEVLEQVNKRNILTVPVGESVDKSERLSDEEDSNLYDPHVWMNPRLWSVIANKIGNVLAEKDSKNKNYYMERTKIYLEKLDDLYNEILTEIKTIPSDRKIIVTAHDAFNYFGKEFGIEMQAIQGVSTESEASASDIQSLANLIYEKKIPAIFVESTIPIKTIEALQESVKSKGHNVKIGGELFSDAMGNKGTEEGTYIGMIKHNAKTIVNALK